MVLPGHARRVLLLQTAVCWAQGQTQPFNIPSVLLLFAVAAVRREAQVGWSCQMLSAAVNLHREITEKGVKSGATIRGLRAATLPLLFFGIQSLTLRTLYF